MFVKPPKSDPYLWVRAQTKGVAGAGEKNGSLTNLFSLATIREMGETTIQQALEDYISVYMPYRNFAERTREEYANDLEDFVQFAARAAIGKVGELGLPIIHRYVANLEQKGFSSLTRKRKVVAIRSFLLFLYQDDYIGANLAAKVVLPFTETRTPYVLTNNECEKLREACAASTRDAAMVEILLQTGMRLSELTRLTANDIDWGSGSTVGNIRISGGRSGKQRVLPLDSQGCIKLQVYLATRKSPATAAVFVNRLGNPLGDRGVQKVIRKYLAAAGIGVASVHTLRHTFGAREAAKGVRRKRLQEEMGLEDPRSISAYMDIGQQIGAERTRKAPDL